MPDIGPLGDLFGVLLAFFGTIGAVYAFLRFLVKPMVKDEIEESRKWYVEFDLREHDKILKEIEKNRNERVEQFGTIYKSLDYIRERLDKLVDKLMA